MPKKKSPNSVRLRNSTAEFLTFAYQTGGDGVEVRVQEGMIWLSQKNIGQLFETTPENVLVHLKKIYAENELPEEATAKEYLAVQMEGNRQVQRSILHYNLDAIIAVGYRVNSKRATGFRQWATGVLRDYTLRGYVMDRKRMENGAFLGEDYFERLLEEIREIRLSERRFYQKIADIYATAMDYDRDAPITQAFFAKVQNTAKRDSAYYTRSQTAEPAQRDNMHYAVHAHTAAELIVKRADHQKERMGLTNWAKAPSGKILKSDVVVGKNYLTEAELEDLGRIVNAYLELAEGRAKRRVPMTMEGWAKRLDIFLSADEREVLQDAGRISAEIAREHAEGEFEKYRVIQDRLFQSDFDTFVALEKGEEGKGNE